MERQIKKLKWRSSNTQHLWWIAKPMRGVQYHVFNRGGVWFWYVAGTALSHNHDYSKKDCMAKAQAHWEANVTERPTRRTKKGVQNPLPLQNSLRWWVDEDDDTGGYYARPKVGVTYRVVPDAAGWLWFIYGGDSIRCESKEDGKAQAQAHWESIKKGALKS